MWRLILLAVAGAAVAFTACGGDQDGVALIGEASPSPRPEAPTPSPTTELIATATPTIAAVVETTDSEPTPTTTASPEPTATPALTSTPTATPTPTPTPTPSPTPAPIGQRSFRDRPDVSSSYQIHVMYVLPSDGVDEKLDTNGAIETSVAAFQRWLEGQTGGRSLRMDTYQGALDITFFRLNQSDSQIRSYGIFVRDEIEDELIAAGFNRANKIYAVYYGGGSDHACGAGPWPPDLPGNVAALYLRGMPPGAPACATNRFASSEDTPGYWEFSMIHEILHVMGVVAICAPNHTLRGHVSDDPRDLMYAGDQPWDIWNMALDVGRDDYFNHGNDNYLDLSNSVFLQ